MDNTKLIKRYMHSRCGCKVGMNAEDIFQLNSTVYKYAKQKHPRHKKVRPSQKHQLIHANKKCDIWWRPKPKQFASNNVRSITYKLQRVQSLTLDVQQFEHN